MTRDDEHLIESFEAGSIPLNQWNQRTHVSIAFLMLRQGGFEEALDRLREGIKAFNERNGIEDSPTGGYNETTTVAMLRLIQATMRACGGVFPAHCAAEFCDLHPQLMSKHVLRFFYSPERRMDPDAKKRFVEPDLAPLPVVVGHALPD
jgi:hypothetical protein